MSPLSLQRAIIELEKSQITRRVALSKRYPLLLPLILWSKRILISLRDQTHRPFSKKRRQKLTFCIYRHQSLLRRKLGTSDPRLQEQKITNIARAIKDLDMVTILPGETFSLWHHLGLANERKGYVGGMLLSGGKVMEGVGGGLCQLSNLLYWMFLHTPLTIVERHHHSLDVFPDSGRTLPFGSGATIFYNLLDLKVKNNTTSRFQLKLWLTENHLKGNVLSNDAARYKYHIVEKDHLFIQSSKCWYRHNELFRETYKRGKLLDTEHITTSIAPVLYDVDVTKLQKVGYTYRTIKK